MRSFLHSWGCFVEQTGWLTSQLRSGQPSWPFTSTSLPRIDSLYGLPPALFSLPNIRCKRVRSHDVSPCWRKLIDTFLTRLPTSCDSCWHSSKVKVETLLRHLYLSHTLFNTIFFWFGLDLRDFMKATDPHSHLWVFVSAPPLVVHLAAASRKRTQR